MDPSEHQHQQQQPGSSEYRQFVCVGCRCPILDQYVLRVAPDMEWHVTCLRCSDCHSQLDENCTCFVRDGKVFCKPDYIRLFGTKCARCHLRFTKNDLVMRAKSNIYHVTCFRCAVCCRQLVSGDEFSLRDDAQLLCKVDHETAYNNNNNMATGNDEMCVDDIVVSTSCSNNNDIDTKNGSSDTSSSHSGLASPDLLPDDQDAIVGQSIVPGGSGIVAESQRHRQPNHNGSFHGHAGGRNGGSGRAHHRGHGGSLGADHHHKTTRIRTVLNEKQLHMLRTCYSANSRPDALMKEQLVEMTGLSPRVIRVWFQNKRCKDKKRSLALKQLHQQQQNKSDGCHLENSWIGHKGVPLIATSPVRHEPSVNILPTPVEVHKFPGGPWPLDLIVQPPLPPGALPPGGHQTPSESIVGHNDSPVPSPVGGVVDVVLPPHVMMHRAGQDLLTAAGLLLQAGQQHTSLGDSFDDDTVVSFDDLSDVVMSSSGTGIGRQNDVIVTSSCHRDGGVDGGHMLRQTPIAAFDEY